MDLTIDYVDEDEISLDQFKVQAKELIKHERDTQNYIKKRLINNIMESNTLNVLSTRSTKTVTYKKDCDALGQYFKIKATYTINGKKIVRAKADNVYLTNVGKVQYSCLDSMRTLGVKYNAKVHFQGIYGMPTTIYAEFNYNG